MSPTKRRILTRRSVLKQLNLDGEVLNRLEELEIVIPVQRPGRERGYRIEDVDRLRVYKVLIRDLGVNPAGAEIILRMRNQIIQFRERMLVVLSQMHAQGMLEDLREVLDSIEDDVC